MEGAISSTQPTADRSRRTSLRVLGGLAAVAVGLAAVAWLAWGKRPLISDTAKLCRVHELSSCALEASEVSACELTWLAGRLWSMGIFDDLVTPSAGVRGLGKGLRQRASAQGLAVCPTADRWDLLGDVEQLCEPPGTSAELDRCLTTDAEGSACARIDVRTRAGVVVRDHLVETADAEGRRGITRDFVTANGLMHRCSSLIALDARKNRREAAREVEEEKTKPMVRLDAPVVDGGLDPSLVTRIVRTRLPQFQICRETVPRTADVSGKLVVYFRTPARGGRVVGVELEENTVRSQALVDCVLKAVRKIEMPAAADGTEVSLPLVFR